MRLTLDSILSLVPINVHRDKKNYIVEDNASGDFYEMPVVCIEAIKMINNGLKLEEIEKFLIEKYPNEEIDLINFAEQLLELKLVAKINGANIDSEIKKEKNISLGFLWISPKIGNFFFNKYSYPLYIVLFVLNILLFIMNPTLFPQHEDIFVFDVMVLNVFLWMTFTFLLVLIHEFGHILAMRAHNLPTKVNVGHRLFFVVLETDMSSVWKLAPKDRNILFLAGICFDTVLLFMALIYLFMFPNGPELVIGLMSLAVFDIVLRIIFQCCFYMKTDLYFVFENMSGCYNLMENALQTILKRLPFLKIKMQEDVVFSGERKTIFIYSIFYLLGIAVTIALYSIYYIPEVSHAGKQLLPGFVKGPTSLAFWDAVVFSLQVSIFLLLLLYSWRKKYTQR
ncbi:hypothetical protein J7E63_07080 [Bacillus sp. ISL-75]|uniref:hypothetical protein n=1 Tax=Bacillus sp. ISL-75 TaxID=2819137 RepID=UPI001BE90FA8|nr:hypothetical protein [Bacillus sp. ISL-75]MBT2726699.1 hypothetical protein [Bacillus sp. ISL-75]